MAEFLSKINSLVVKDNNKTIGELYFPALNDSSLLPKVENLTENISLSPLLKTTIKKIEDAYKQKPNNNPTLPPNDGSKYSPNDGSKYSPDYVYNQSYGDFKYKIINNSDNGSATSDFEYNSKEQNSVNLFGKSINIKPDIKPLAIKPASRKLYSIKSKKKESDIRTADILTVANMRSDNEQTNSSININSIEASPIQFISPNASNGAVSDLSMANMSFQSNRKTRMSSDLLSTQHSQLNTSQANSSSASRFKPPNLFND